MTSDEVVTESSPLTHKLDPAIWHVIAVVLLGPLMAQMDSTIVNVSLSSIKDALHSNISSSQWVISGYLLALALTLPLNGWIVARLGAKRLYLWCFSGFTLTSVLCGSARTMNELICARILQGIAGGLLAPLAQMMLARIAGKHMARVLGYAATPVLLAPTFGPILAGLVLKCLSWSWLFYINLPVGILAVTLATILLPKDDPQKHKHTFDLWGFLLISPGLVCLLYGGEQASHGGGLASLISGFLLLGAFVWHSRRDKSNALLDLDIFQNRIFTTATTTQFFANGAMYAGQFLIPLYLSASGGLGAAKIGWMLAPMGIGMICIYPWIGTLTETLGCRAVSVGGVLLNVLGTLPFLWMSQSHISSSWVVASLFARGIGQGATGIPTISAAYSSVQKDRLGMATTTLNIVQRLGGPTATTVLAIVMSISNGSLGRNSAPHSFFVPFIVLIMIQLFVLASASRLPVRI